MITKCFTIAILLLGFNACAQLTNFEINGTIKGLDTGFVQIYCYKNDATLRTPHPKVPLTNGKFTFKGQLSVIYLVPFIINFGKDSIVADLCYVDTGKQSITIQLDRIAKTASVTTDSRKINDFIMECESKIDLLRLKKREYYREQGILFEKYNGNVPKSEDDRVQALIDGLQDQEDSTLFSYIKQHPDSYLGLYELRSSMMHGFNPIYDSCFLYLDTTRKASAYGKSTARKLDNARSTATGSLFPGIKMNDTSGRKVVFNKNMLKEYTLCDFWFGACQACIDQFPKLRDVYSKWGAKDFEIIGISVERAFADTPSIAELQAEANWKKAIKKYNLLWPQYWDIRGSEAEIFSIYSYPTNFLLDKTGRIVAKNISPDELGQFLTLNLKE